MSPHHQSNAISSSPNYQLLHTRTFNSKMSQPQPFLAQASHIQSNLLSHNHPHTPSAIDPDAYQSYINSNLRKLQNLILFYGANIGDPPETVLGCLALIKWRIFANIRDYLKGSNRKFSSRRELKKNIRETRTFIRKDVAKMDMCTNALLQPLD